MRKTITGLSHSICGRGILRHNNKDKWFAVIMTVDRSKLIKGENLLRKNRLGFGSRMPNWLTVVLDGTADDEDIKLLMDMSYTLTEK